MVSFRKTALLWAAVFIMGALLPLPLSAQPLGIMSQPQQQKSKVESLSAQNGRYVFGQISDSSKDKFMLDTWTGRLWRVAETGKIGVHLKTVPYLMEGGDTSPAPEPLKKD